MPASKKSSKKSKSKTSSKKGAMKRKANSSVEPKMKRSKRERGDLANEIHQFNSTRFKDFGAPYGTTAIMKYIAGKVNEIPSKNEKISTVRRIQRSVLKATGEQRPKRKPSAYNNFVKEYSRQNKDELQGIEDNTQRLKQIADAWQVSDERKRANAARASMLQSQINKLNGSPKRDVMPGSRR